MIPLTIIVLHGASGNDPDEADTRMTAETICASLNRQGHSARLAHVSGATITLPWAHQDRPDLVFNMVEAIDRNMSRAVEIPLLLEKQGVPFTGCGAAAHLITASKIGQKRRMARHGLPTPDWSLSGAGLAHLDRVIVKSVSEHASLGMDARSVVPSRRAMAEIAARERRFATGFFAEAYIAGREFNLSLVENDGGVTILPPAEIVFKDFAVGVPHIVDYAAKWDAHSYAYSHTPRRFDFPADDQRLLNRLGHLARRAWALFALTGYARVDFRVDHKGNPWILEVNTNPCLAPDAGFFAAAERAGFSYDGLIARLVKAGHDMSKKDSQNVPHPQGC